MKKKLDKKYSSLIALFFYITFALTFILLNSKFISATSCSFSSLTISNPTLHTNDQEQQQAILTIYCANANDLNLITDVRIQVNRANTANQPYRGYFQWTPSLGFREYSSYGNEHVTLLPLQSQYVLNPVTQTAQFIFTWTASPSYGNITDNDLYYSWTESGVTIPWGFTDTNFSTIVVESVYPTLQNITLANPNPTLSGSDTQSTDLYLTMQGTNPISDLRILINRANTASLPYRGYFQWTPAEGFKEYSTSYGNSYVELLPNQSFYETLPNNLHHYHFTWKILSTYGLINQNTVSYWWTEPTNGRTIGWITPTIQFNVVQSAPQVPQDPTNLNTLSGDQQITLSWNAPFDGGSPILDYIVEYAPEGQNFVVYPDGVSTLPSTTLTGLTNGLLYSLKVSAVNAIGTGPSSQVVTASPVAGPLVPEPTVINHILITGQSLATGANGQPPLSTTQPYRNTFMNGTRIALLPLTETKVETIASGMGNTLTSLAPNLDYAVHTSNNGAPSTNYVGLKKGSIPYYIGMVQVNRSRDLVAALPKPYRVVAIAVIHGENDHINGTGDFYEQYLVEWQKDYDQDIKFRTHQTENVLFFTDQLASFTMSASNFSRIPIAQLAAAENNPGKIYLVTPKYIFPYSDGRHLTNYGYRWLGEYYGKVMKQVLIDGQQWRPLSPDTITRTGNIITVQFHVPVPPLQFDTTRVLAKTNYGFEYYDNQQSATITNVAITGPTTVEITLSQEPTGTNQRLRYAYTGTANAWAGPTSSGSARGNLRDTDLTPSLYGNDLFNWAVVFDKPIL